MYFYRNFTGKVIVTQSTITSFQRQCLQDTFAFILLSNIAAAINASEWSCIGGSTIKSEMLSLSIKLVKTNNNFYTLVSYDYHTI